MNQEPIKLAADAVVFAYKAPKEILILLVRRKYAPFQGAWALPGGFVQPDEDLEEAVKRELSEETGVKLAYLEQLYTFGKTERDPRGRVVSVAYFGLISPQGLSIEASTDAEEVQWFSLKSLPELAFDHRDIIQRALMRLRAKVGYEPIGFELLGEKFLFGELENLYMSLLDRPIDRRNFRKKVLALGILDELAEKVSQGPGRPAKLFRFNKENYFKRKEEGIFFDI